MTDALGEKLRLIESIASYGEGKNPDMDAILSVCRRVSPGAARPPLSAYQSNQDPALAQRAIRASWSEVLRAVEPGEAAKAAMVQDAYEAMVWAFDGEGLDIPGFRRRAEILVDDLLYAVLRSPGAPPA